MTSLRNPWRRTEVERREIESAGVRFLYRALTVSLVAGAIACAPGLALVGRESCIAAIDAPPGQEKKQPTTTTTVYIPTTTTTTNRPTTTTTYVPPTTSSTYAPAPTTTIRSSTTTTSVPVSTTTTAPQPPSGHGSPNTPGTQAPVIYSAPYIAPPTSGTTLARTSSPVKEKAPVVPVYVQGMVGLLDPNNLPEPVAYDAEMTSTISFDDSFTVGYEDTETVATGTARITMSALLGTSNTKREVVRARRRPASSPIAGWIPIAALIATASIGALGKLAKSRFSPKR